MLFRISTGPHESGLPVIWLVACNSGQYGCFLGNLEVSCSSLKNNRKLNCELNNYTSYGGIISMTSTTRVLAIAVFSSCVQYGYRIAELITGNHYYNGRQYNMSTSMSLKLAFPRVDNYIQRASELQPLQLAQFYHSPNQHNLGTT